ncbi:MAG: aminopeptidase P N-terminal domain-containing protein, partial [Flavobacteriales bacterium]|nr:aminopeptidase P N-terminal domain-containing protein [Flavobacteriales bacterium]
MRYPALPAEFYSGARKRFAAAMKPGGLAIFCSNDIMPTSADGHMPFKQASDIFYLTGVDQEESLLIIFPDSFHAHHREILFLKETSETIAIWEGAKLNKEQATALTGIKTVYWLSEFERVLRAVLAEAKYVYLNSNEHMRAVVEVETREMRFSKWFRQHYPHYVIERSAPIMHQLRAVKQKE